MSSLETAVPFYRDVLGLKLVMGPSETDSGEALSRGLGVPGAEVRVAIFDTGDGSLNLELLQYVNPPSPIEKPVPSNAIGASHLAFRVDDIDAKVKELSEKGVRFNAPLQVIDEGPLTGMHRVGSTSAVLTAAQWDWSNLTSVLSDCHRQPLHGGTKESVVGVP